jgi:hypothetical protein
MNLKLLTWLLPLLYLKVGEEGVGGDGGSMLEEAGNNDDEETGGEGGDDESTAPAHFATFGEDGAVGDRPEWVQEQFWDADKGFDAVKAMKSYGELRNEFNTKVADAQQLDKGKGLESADKYLEDFKAPEAGEGEDLSNVGELSGDDPAVKAFANVAQRHGMSKDRFNAILKDYMVELNEHLPTPVDMAAEWTKLGGKERGLKVAGAVVSDLKAMTSDDPDARDALNEQELGALLKMGNNADFISAMSKVMAKTRGDAPIAIPTGGVTLDGAPTTAEVHAWQGELVAEGVHKGQRRYDVDPQWRGKVDRAWEMAAGTGTTRRTSRLPAAAGNA